MASDLLEGASPAGLLLDHGFLQRSWAARRERRGTRVVHAHGQATAALGLRTARVIVDGAIYLRRFATGDESRSGLKVVGNDHDIFTTRLVMQSSSPSRVHFQTTDASPSGEVGVGKRRSNSIAQNTRPSLRQFRMAAP